MRLRRLTPLLSALFLTVGCAETGSGDVELTTLALSPGALERCGSTGCGVNGPDTDGHGYGELNAYGLVNDYGYYISEVETLGRDSLSLTVVGTGLQGTLRSGKTLTGNDLVGTSITVRNVEAREDLYWTLRLIEYENSTTYWIGSESETIPSYRFAAGSNGGPESNLCNHGITDEYELLHHAFIYEGDRYDRHLKTVSEEKIDSGWFNIACTGATASKLLRLRHARVAADGEISPGTDERQAVYKAIVGDLCGTGESLTKPGVPLFTRLAVGWGWNYGCKVSSYEAIWDANGAMCIEEYRLADDPEMVDKLAAACDPIQACTAAMREAYATGNGDSGWMRSANPTPDIDEGCVMFGD